MSNNDKYQTIKVRRGTIRLLRQLSFEKDVPMVDVVKTLAEEEMARLKIKPR